MSNLIAYIPVLNQRHLDWFKKHPNSQLFLITQQMAEQLIPRLQRNMAAVPTEVMISMLQPLTLVNRVSEFAPEHGDPNLAITRGWFLPDEDISRQVAEKYLLPAEAPFKFEMIWARWDMTAVHMSQPVIADVVVSDNYFDRLRMNLASLESGRSPDWWRQIGCFAVDGQGNPLAITCNTHLPNEYETYIFGDPRLNVDAGQKGKYTALHSEQAIVALCGKAKLEGGSMYVTTFPCEECARWIAFSGVKKLFFRDGYSVLNAQDVLRSYGVQIVQVVEDPGTV